MHKHPPSLFPYRPIRPPNMPGIAFGEHQNAKLPFDISAWKLKSRKDIPKQTDDFSCGLMMIMTAECIGLEKPILYSQDDAALVRQKIQYLLIAESVEDPYIYQINQN